MLAYCLIWSALSFSPSAPDQFAARGRDYGVLVDKKGVTLTLSEGPVRLEWKNAGTVEGMERLPGVVNRYTPGAWREGLPRYARLRQRSAWTGVDVVYYGNERQLEMDFVLQPGADLRKLELTLAGASASLVSDGSLRLRTKRGEVELQVPNVYQTVGGERHKVEARYVLRGDRIGFAVGRYDKKRPLVIDPVVAYSSYFGGSGDDVIFGATVDASGAMYLTGFTASTDLPLPSPSPAPPFNGLSGGVDAFVAKIAPGGNTLEYVTYLGGSAEDQGQGIAVDGAHNAYVVGFTSSPDFPLQQAVQGTYTDGGRDAFVTMLGPTGALAYSTYLGSAGFDDGSAIAVDSTGAAYVAGDCDGPFPSPAPQTPAGTDAWVVKLGPRPSDGSAPELVYTKLLGGTDIDFPLGLAIDGSHAAYVTGVTSSNDFPLCQNGPCPSPSPGFMRPGMMDSFISKLTPAGDQLVYSRLLGGSGDDIGRGVAVEAGGSAYVVGLTNSRDFPTVNAFQPAFGGTSATDNDAFAVKLSPSGGSVLYSTYLGGSADDEASAVAIDPAGGIYIGGSTFSTNFPVTSTAVMKALPNAMGSAFVVRINTQGNGLAWGTYFGGSDNVSSVLSLATDGISTYAAGFTNATDLVQMNAVTTRHSGEEGFVVKLAPGAEPPLPALITPSSAPADTNTPVTITGANFTSGATVTFDGAACSNAVVANSETITCITPRHAAGAVTVVVTNPDLQTGSISFTFDAPTAPILTSVSPSSGSVSGGTRVTISGAKIAAGATVTFGGTAATSISVIDSTRVSVTTPAHAAGAVDVVVSNGTGLDATLIQAFTYVVAPGDSPTITAIAPNSGPVEGGTHITLLGNDFANGATITVDGTAATGVSFLDTKTLLAVTPPGTAGAADVTVTNPNGRSFTLSGGFTYGTSSSALSVVSVVPATGSTNGGDHVTVLGTNFTTGAIVLFGGVQATGVQEVDNTQLKVTTPAHLAGPVDVVVRTLDGQQARLSNGFTYSTDTGGGCGCHVGGNSEIGGWWLVAMIAAWLLARRRLLVRSSTSSSSWTWTWTWT